MSGYFDSMRIRAKFVPIKNADKNFRIGFSDLFLMSMICIAGKIRNTNSMLT
jgi:hypothetical protein